MNFADDCAECAQLSARYESVTMQWFRLQGELRIATWSRDENASDRLVAELTRIGRHRGQLRQAAEAHIEAAHPRVVSANSGRF